MPSDRKRTSSHSHDKNSKKSKHGEVEDVRNLKHFDTFYKDAPPGLVQEEEEKPEDCIPDLPENKEAREFLAHAPKKGLWMPLGKEVKVMKCWRCKQYGHRTGDRECPMFVSGNSSNEQFRYAHEDPMHDLIQESKKNEKLEKIKALQALLDDSSTESSSGDEKASKHKHKKKHKKKSSKQKKKKKKKHKH